MKKTAQEIIMNEPNFELLFPTPVMSTKLGRAFTKEELNFVIKHGEKDMTRPNVGNLTTINQYILEEPELADIKKILTEAVNKYIKTVEKPARPVELYITQSWMNYTNQGGYHHKHDHPNSYLSGTIYINADPKLDSITFYKPGYTQLCMSTNTYDIYNSKSWWINVENGGIIVFPSSLTHSVAPVRSDKTRISLSFNTFFKGVLGDTEESTELINE